MSGLEVIGIVASVVGIIAAAGKVAELLNSAAPSFTQLQPNAIALSTEVSSTEMVLSALQGLLLTPDLVPEERRDMVQLSQLVTLLTNGALLLSDMEALVTKLGKPVDVLRSRIRWGRKEKELGVLYQRLNSFRGNMAIMLSILQCVSDTEASRKQTRLSISIDELLQSNRDLNKRMLRFESRLPSIEDDASAAASSHGTIQHRSPSAFESLSDLITGFSFEEDLENSRVYRQIYRTSVDYSFRSSVARSHAWTLLSLRHMSLASVIALPLQRSEIMNAGHYPSTRDGNIIRILGEAHSRESCGSISSEPNMVSPEHLQMPNSILVDGHSNVKPLANDQVSSSDYTAQEVELLKSLALQLGGKTKNLSPEELELHLADEITSWLDIEATSSASSYSLVQFNRLDNLRSHKYPRYRELHHHPTQFPRLVAFTGYTCVGKSALIRSLIQLGGRMTGRSDFPQPVVGPMKDLRPTSSGIHLYSDPATRFNSQSLLYADCQGLNDLSSPPVASYCKMRDVKHAVATMQGSNPKTDGEAAVQALYGLNSFEAPAYMTSDLTNTSELDDIGELYSMLMYATAGVVVFVTTRLSQRLLLSPVHWARSSIDHLGDRHARPELVIVVNTPDARLSELHGPSIAKTTRFGMLIEVDPLWGMIEEFGSDMANYIEEFHEQGLEIRTMHDLLLQYYSAVDILMVPYSIEDKELYDRRLKGLYDLVYNLKTNGRADRSMDDLQRQATLDVHLLAKGFLGVERA